MQLSCKVKCGEGTFGTVYTGFDSSGVFVGVKKFKNGCDDGYPADVCRELAALQIIPAHTNLVQLLRFEYADDGISPPCMVMMGAKHNMINFLRNRSVSFGMCKRLTLHLALALRHIHLHGIMHRDVKPQNTLIYESPAGPVARLADFGLSKIHVAGRANTLEVTTLWYRAPEILFGVTSYGPSVDTWAVGLMILELLRNGPACPGDCMWGQLQEYFRLLGTPEVSNWPELVSAPYWRSNMPKFSPDASRLTLHDQALHAAVQATLVFNPERRCTSEQLVSILQDDTIAVQGDVLITTPTTAVGQVARQNGAETAQAVKDAWSRGQIKLRMRPILVAWLAEVQHKFKFHTRTLHTAVYLLDAILTRSNVEREKLQLLGMVALWSASKIEDEFTCTAADLRYICDRAYTIDEILAYEHWAMKKLEHASMRLKGSLLYDLLSLDATPKLKLIVDLTLLLSPHSCSMPTLMLACERLANGRTCRGTGCEREVFRDLRNHYEGRTDFRSIHQKHNFVPIQDAHKKRKARS